MSAVPVPSRRFKAGSKPAQNLTPGRIIRRGATLPAP